MSLSIANNRAVIVPASAGSGKTFRIAHEYIYDVLRDRYDEEGKPYFDRSFYKRILAVTFTNKATEEMKSRILKEIHLLASGAKSDHLDDLISETSLDEATLRKRAKIVRSLILHDYSHFTVLTNDTFFQRILRAFVRELGIDMNFSTELDTAPVLAKSTDALIESISENKELRRWLEELTEERIRDGERWDIREAITLLNDELFNESSRDIIAKGSDKESLKKSIQNFSAMVRSSREAFIAKGQLFLNTISSRGYTHDNFAGRFTKMVEPVADGTFNEIKSTISKHLADPLENWFNKGKATPDLLNLAGELQPLLNEICDDFVNLRTLENTHRILSRNYRGFALLHDLQKMVEEVCRDDNSMLLSETKHLISNFISESEAPFIYEKVGNYFDKFMIDEFQDTSAKEWRNFLPLLRNAMSQSTDTSVLIVGDVKQSIYRWRGGDWRILGGEVARDLAESRSIPLKNNWRSLPNIVEFNTALFDSIVKQQNEVLNAQLDNAMKAKRLSKECREELYNTLERAYADHEQKARRKHTNNGYISMITPVEGEKAMVNRDGMPLYIERIREILERGYLPRDITILVRKNSHGMDIAKELLSYRDCFPKELWFEITTEEALSLAASPAVKLIIAVMRLAINRRDTTSLVQYNHLHKDDLFGAVLDKEEHAFLDTIRMMSPEEAFNNITIRYADDLKGQTAYVLALHEHICRFSANRVADLALFDKWWREKGNGLSVRVERSERTIEILTIHKSKGLENKVIVIPNCSWSMSPTDSSGYTTNIVWAKPNESDYLDNIGEFPVLFNSSMAESFFADDYFREVVYACVDALNMLYVATTRAKEQLHIFLPNNGVRNSINQMLVATYSNRMQQVEGTNYRQYEIGTFDVPEPEERVAASVSNRVIKEHSVSPVTLKFRTSASRYFADEKGALTPRSMGIRLHRVFESAVTREEIFATLDEMAINGELSREETASLKAQITDTLDNSIAGEWFDGSWERLHRERNIIRPNATSKRPDRVMTRGKEAVVVDYKFGEESNIYHRQITEYMEILREMGYTTVKGYIWYVTAGKIVNVEG